MSLSGEQLIAARCMLRIGRPELSRRSSVSIEALRRMERTSGPLSEFTEETIAVRKALEEHGVIFIAAGADQPLGPGVRLRGGMPSAIIALETLNASNDS